MRQLSVVSSITFIRPTGEDNPRNDQTGHLGSEARIVRGRQQIGSSAGETIAACCMRQRRHTVHSGRNSQGSLYPATWGGCAGDEIQSRPNRHVPSRRLWFAAWSAWSYRERTLYFDCMVRQGSEVRFVTRENFEQIVEEEPELYSSVLQVLAAEVRFARLALAEN